MTKKGKHLCRECNKWYDKEDIKLLPTEFFSSGKPIKQSCIWICKNCELLTRARKYEHAMKFGM